MSPITKKIVCKFQLSIKIYVVQKTNKIWTCLFAEHRVLIMGFKKVFKRLEF